MGVVGVLLGLVLLVFELALVARMVLDWVGVLAPGDGSWSIPARRTVHAVTEPVLAPVRRVLPPVRLGSVSIDLAFTVVFVLRAGPAHDRGKPVIAAGPVDFADGCRHRAGTAAGCRRWPRSVCGSRLPGRGSRC